jgi:hypothetical protein
MLWRIQPAPVICTPAYVYILLQGACHCSLQQLLSTQTLCAGCTAHLAQHAGHRLTGCDWCRARLMAHPPSPLPPPPLPPRSRPRRQPRAPRSRPGSLSRALVRRGSQRQQHLQFLSTRYPGHSTCLSLHRATRLWHPRCLTAGSYWTGWRYDRALGGALQTLSTPHVVAFPSASRVLCLLHPLQRTCWRGVELTMDTTLSSCAAVWDNHLSQQAACHHNM